MWKYYYPTLYVLLVSNVFKSTTLQCYLIEVCGSFLAQEMIFGWILSNMSNNHNIIHCRISLGDEISSFWVVENILRRILSVNMIGFVKIFVKELLPLIKRVDIL